MRLTAGLRIFLFKLVYFGPLPLSGHLVKPERRPQPLWKGDARRGKEIIQKQFVFSGVAASFSSRKGWHAETPLGGEWCGWLASFGWVADVMAFSNTKLGASHLQEYLIAWMARPPGGELWHEPEITGRRLGCWMESLMFMLAGAPPAFRRYFLRFAATDALYLCRDMQSADPQSGFEAARGLLFASLSLPGAEMFGRVALAHVRKLLAQELLADGSHKNRSARLQMDTLRALVEMRAALKRAGKKSALFDAPIMQTASALTVLLHGDGRLALFNDTVCGEVDFISALLEKAGSIDEERDRTQSGFYQLARGATRAIMDAGTPAAGYPCTHAGALSFELSDGAQRIIVNCGAYRGQRADWRQAMHSTAAHSTLCLSHTDSFFPLGFMTEQNQPHAQAESGEAGRRPFVEASHDGYVALFGRRHHRKLTLGESGQALFGVDRLEKESEAKDTPPLIELRFHLHPEATALKEGEGKVSLRLPGSMVWLFECAAPVEVEESVYLGEGGRPLLSSQLVVRHTLDGTSWDCSWNLAKQA